MPLKTRDQLKDYFKNGNVVKEKYFADFIDSTYSKKDDPVKADQTNGVSVVASKLSNRFVSFFKSLADINGAKPMFFLERIKRTNAKINQIAISTLFDSPKQGVMRIFNLVTYFDQHSKKQKAKIGIDKISPVYELDVNGVVGAHSFVGTYQDANVDASKVIADSKWYSILTSKNGFQCYEISATVFSKEYKSIMQGKLIFAYGETEENLIFLPKPRDLFPHKNQLEIRWRDKGGAYDLQIRTHGKLGGTPKINYKLTKIVL